MHTTQAHDSSLSPTAASNTDAASQQMSAKQTTLLPPLPIVRGLAHGAAGRRRKPTLQDMYNTWRALEEQVDRIPRLPMFIKAETKFCHACRILKRRCECFDYSQLEAVFQEKNDALKQRALHEVPVSRATTPTPRTRTRTRTQTRSSSSQPPSQDIKQEDFDFNVLSAPLETPASQKPKERPRPAKKQLSHASSVVRFERRAVVLATEKIGANSRRWRCLFGSGQHGSPVCMREDDNMETIRRHYGREHGRHRYHKKPTISIRCSSCGGRADSMRPPAACPQCSAAHAIWLREMTAVIEVPVPTDASLLGDAAVNNTLAPSLAVLHPPTPRTPGTPRTPLTPFTTSFSAFSPPVPFESDAMAMFPFDSSGVPSQQAQARQPSPAGSSSTYTASAAPFAGSDMCSIDASLAAPATLQGFPALYGTALAAQEPMAAAMAATTAHTPTPYVQAPAEVQLQQMQQSYMDLGAAMTMDDMHMMAMSTYY